MVPESPAWQARQEAQNRLWERALQYRQQGYTLCQAYAFLGLLPDEPEEPSRIADLPPVLRERLRMQARDEARAELAAARIEDFPDPLRVRLQRWAQAVADQRESGADSRGISRLVDAFRLF